MFDCCMDCLTLGNALIDTCEMKCDLKCELYNDMDYYSAFHMVAAYYP
jgi:hypothetical protein